MKIGSTIALVLAGVLLGGCATERRGVAPQNYITDLDFTVPTCFDVAGDKGKRALREFGTNNCPELAEAHVFGQYGNPMDFWAGCNFHVFPGGGFVIAIEDFRTGEPLTLASGKWRLDRNTLEVSGLVPRQTEAAPPGLKWVREHFGTVDKMRVFVTASGESIEDTILVAEETASGSAHFEGKYFRRIRYDRDWPKRQRELMAQGSAQETNSPVPLTVIQYCLEPFRTFEIVGTDVRGVKELGGLTTALRKYRELNPKARYEVLAEVKSVPEGEREIVKAIADAGIRLEHYWAATSFWAPNYPVGPHGIGFVDHIRFVDHTSR
jgi:hypothetical protein